MPIVQARIETEHPSRYLGQFCKHAAAMGDGGYSPRMHLHPGMQHDVPIEAHYGATAGTVTFAAWGRCDLAADAGTLTVRIESADEEGLQRIQDIVTKDFARFSSRAPLTVLWRRDESPGEASAPGDSSRDTGARVPSTAPSVPGRRGGRWARGTIGTVVLVLGAVLLAAVHLGLAGPIVAHSRWTGVAADVVAALVVLKVAVIIAVRQRLHRRKNAG